MLFFQLRQEVPHDLHDGLRASAGGAVRRELQEELLHRVQEGGSERHCRVLSHSPRQGLQHRGPC